MYNHAPKDYICPFCLVVRGIENEHVYSVAGDVFYRNEEITALICSHQWPRTSGHALVIPNQHFENIFDLPLNLGTQIHQVVQKTALAMKATYNCDGISTRQHNEPAGNQDVWHYHCHVFPRYHNDQLYSTERHLMSAVERAGYAHKLRAYFEDNRDE